MAAAPEPTARKRRLARPAAGRAEAPRGGAGATARPTATGAGARAAGAGGAHRGAPGAARRIPAPGAEAGAGRRVARRVPRKVLGQFTAQLATLVNAGLPLVRSLRLLERQQKPGPFRNVVLAVGDDVESGAPLSEALSKYPGVFDRLYVNMVRAGEAGGVLGTILERLATFAQKSERIRSALVAALAYPAMVLLFAFIVVLFVVAVIVPKFEEIFDDFDAEMPAPTRLLIAFSENLTGHWYLWAAVPVLLVAAFVAALRHEGFARWIDRVVLVLPVTGRLLRKTTVARFSRTLGTLLTSGVPILESLSIVQASIRNRVVGEAVGDVHEALRQGEDMAPPLAESGVFDDVVVDMIEVGEETGQLDAMLVRIADNFEAEVDAEVTRVLKVLEPTVIFVMAVGVGSIVVALFMPILRIMESVQAG